MKAVEVLMVEDNRGDVVLVQAAIEEAGLPYHVTVVSDGAEALEFLHRRGKYSESSRPDLIMLDLKLPRKNGCEVLDEIRLDPAVGHIPLVLLSSSKSELKRARSYGLPPECYLEKAATFQDFVELVRTIEAFRRKAAEEGQCSDSR
jgi:two-component system response regulator